MVTPCCGFVVGSACVEEVYDDDEICWNCSSSRPAPASQTSETDKRFADIPAHIRRFTRRSDSLPSPSITTALQPAEHHNKVTIANVQTTISFLPLTSLTPSRGGETLTSQERLKDALQTFLHSWQTENTNLSESERYEILGEAQIAIAGKLFLPTHKFATTFSLTMLRLDR